MNKERIVLGLDIGIGSVGWGLVKLNEQKYEDKKPNGDVYTKYRIKGGEIIDCGVRSFQVPQDRQKKSLAVKRGMARRARKATRHKAQRLKRLIRLAKEYGLIGEDFSREKDLKPKKGDTEEKWDIWHVRNRALEEKVTDLELFRIMYHIAKHRGFYFHTKAEEMKEGDKNSEEGKAKKGLARVQKKMEKGGWETVGQMFCEEFKQTNKKNKRKRNSENNYKNSIHRSLLKDEIEKIFARQKEFGNEKAKDILKKRYIDEVLMYEKGIDDEKLQRMMKKCEFTGKICAPRKSYTAERFKLFNRLNSLEIVNTRKRNEPNELKEEQVSKIAELAYEKNKVTYSQIRKCLGLEDELHKRFNMCSYRGKNPEYEKKLSCDVKNGRPEFNAKHKLELVEIETGEIKPIGEHVQQLFKRRAKRRLNSKKISLYYSDIRKSLNISNNYRFSNLNGYIKSATELGSEAKYLKQFEKDTFVELKGYHEIRKTIQKNCDDGKWDEIASDVKTLDTIAEALVYHKSDETRREYLNGNGINDEELIEAVLTMNMKEVHNFSKQAIRKLLVHMEKGYLFNDAKEKAGLNGQEYDKQPILKPYSGFFENNPVVARVISQTRKLVNAIIRKYQNDYPIDQIHVEVATDVAKSEKNKRKIENKQRRYQEEKQAAIERCEEFGIDPFKGQNLLKFRLAGQQNYRCPYTNRAITLYESGVEDEVHLDDCEIDHILPMSRSFNDSLNNKVLCTQKANQEKRNQIPYEWINKSQGPKKWHEFELRVNNMVLLPYGKKRNLLRKQLTEEDKEEFISRNLNDTRYAAKHFADYLRKYFDFSKSRRDDIKEVSRIQLRSGSITAFLRHMWGLNKIREENDLHHALDALVMACSTYGHVYLVSNLSKQIEEKGKHWYKHFGRDKFKPWDDIRMDIEESVEDVFVSRMQRHKVTGAAHKETVLKKKEESKKRVIEVNGGYAEMGEMVRADVFVDEKGKNYVVPIYSVDIFSNKPLPNKYLNKNSAAYRDWPSVKDDNLNFKFSLFKDDLISLDGKMYYVDYVRATRSVISLKKPDGSDFEKTGKNAKEASYRNAELRKYSADLLGNYKEIKQEKRLGNRFGRK